MGRRQRPSAGRIHRLVLSLLAAHVCLAVAAGCGDEQAANAPSQTSTSATEAEAGDTGATTPPAPAFARSERDCLELWNSTERAGSPGQTGADYVAEERGKVMMVLHDWDGRGRKDCVLLVPYRDDPRRGLAFVAVGGVGPFSTPARVRVADLVGDPSRIPYNAKANSEGQLTPLG